ncbi:MAG: hypothetical protein AB7R67_20315 [Vicinamibacterales bacterium]
MNPVLVTLGLRALKFLIAVPALRPQFAATLEREGADVGATVVNALKGNAEAIKLVADELDEALAANKGIQTRLEQRARQEGTRLHP